MKHKRIVGLGVVCVFAAAALVWFVLSHRESATTNITAELESTNARTYVDAANQYAIGSADWIDIMLNAAIDAADKGKCRDARSIYETVGQHISTNDRQAYDGLKSRIQSCGS